MQPTLELSKVNNTLLEAIQEKRQKIHLNFCTETTGICKYCHRHKYAPLFSSEDELERHQWSNHLNDIFRHLKPSRLSYSDYSLCLDEFVENEMKAHSDFPRNQKFDTYSCLYCNDPNRLQSCGKGKKLRRLDNNTIFNHIMKEHLNDMEDHLKETLNYKLEEVTGKISGEMRKKIERARIICKRQYKEWSDDFMNKFLSAREPPPATGGIMKPQPYMGFNQLVEYAPAWWKKQQVEAEKINNATNQNEEMDQHEEQEFHQGSGKLKSTVATKKPIVSAKNKNMKRKRATNKPSEIIGKKAVPKKKVDSGSKRNTKEENWMNLHQS